MLQIFLKFIHMQRPKEGNVCVFFAFVVLVVFVVVAVAVVCCVLLWVQKV